MGKATQPPLLHYTSARPSATAIDVIKRAAIHSTLAVLIVVAQFGALTHSVWHLGDQATRHAVAAISSPSHAHDSKSPAQNGGALQPALCDLHVVMGSVLAGDCAGASTLPAVTPSLPVSRGVAAGFLARASPTPVARGPPALL